MASSWRSVRLREVGQIACAAEWLATSGPTSARATSQKPGFVEVAEVDHDAQLGAAADERAAGRRQAGPGVRTRRGDERHAMAEIASPGSTPGRAIAGRPHATAPAPPGPGRSPPRPPGGEQRPAGRRRRAQRPGQRSPRDPDGWRRLRSRREQAPGGARREGGGVRLSDRLGQRDLHHPVGAGNRSPVLARRRREHGEDPAAHAPGAHPGQVQVTAGPAGGDVRVVVPGERVVVTVEHRDHAHERSGRGAPGRTYTCVAHRGSLVASDPVA